MTENGVWRRRFVVLPPGQSATGSEPAGAQAYLLPSCLPGAISAASASKRRWFSPTSTDIYFKFAPQSGLLRRRGSRRRRDGPVTEASKTSLRSQLE